MSNLLKQLNGSVPLGQSIFVVGYVGKSGDDVSGQIAAGTAASLLAGPT